VRKRSAEYDPQLGGDPGRQFGGGIGDRRLDPEAAGARLGDAGDEGQPALGGAPVEQPDADRLPRPQGGDALLRRMADRQQHLVVN